MRTKEVQIVHWLTSAVRGKNLRWTRWHRIHCGLLRINRWTKPRHWMPRFHRSSAPSARARSCGSARTRRSSRSRPISTGSLGLDIALGVGGLPQGPHHRDLWAGKLGQDDAGAAYHCRSPEEGRHLRLHRCRACAGPGLCPQAGRRPRRPADFAARHRRTGAGNRRHAGALRRHRRAGHRFGGGTDAARRNRRRNGRQPARPAGPPDEPGAAQADRLDLALQHAWSSSSTRSA